MNKTSLLFPLLALLATAAVAQPSFVDVTPTVNPYFVTPADEDFWLNSLAAADIDGDGDLDLAAIGFYVVYNVSAEDRLVLFFNQGVDGDGHWIFTNVEVPIGTLSAGASDLAWGDYDGDGDDDLAVGSDGTTLIFRNDAGTLTALPNELPGYTEDSAYSGAYDLRSLTWADFDNDGDVDLLVPSVWNPDTGNYSNALLRNDGPDGLGGWTFTDAAAAIDPTVHAQGTWADEDGDGDLDLLLLNVDTFTGSGFLRKYNNVDGNFVAQAITEFSELQGLVDWADADADGDLDLLVVGNLLEPEQVYNTVLRIYLNDGAGGYSPITLIDAPNGDWLDLHAATWADYDSDGDVDILVTGSYVGDGEILGHSFVFANEGNNWSALPIELPAPLSSVGRGGSFTWLDLDGDGDLDYLVGGAYNVPNGNGLVEAKLMLFRNEAAAQNQPPSAPTGLLATQQPGGVQLSWNAAGDDHTSASALTYDFEIRPQGAPAIFSGRLPEPGSIGQTEGWMLKNLLPGNYIFSVCAVDSAFTGGAKSEKAFSVFAGAEIFADGFEGGNTSAWSLALP